MHFTAWVCLSVTLTKLYFIFHNSVFELESMETVINTFFVDDAGFSPAKERQERHWLTGHNPNPKPAWWQCAAISNPATLGPHNTQHLFTLLGGLRDILVGRVHQDNEQAEQPVYVIDWDNVS